MPPHCDSLDGPVVTAARQALLTRDVTGVLAFVPEHSEAEVRAMFDTVLPVRQSGGNAREVADQLFFETVVRVHRAGEGAPYTGLKPAGLSEGPVIPLAERAVESGSPKQLADFLAAALREELTRRLQRVRTLAMMRDRSVQDDRHYVEAMLGFLTYSHQLFEALHAPDHDDAGHEGTRPAIYSAGRGGSGSGQLGASADRVASSTSV